MNQEDQADKTSQISADEAGAAVVPAKAPEGAPEPGALSEEDLAQVSGGTASKTTEGIKKTMQTQ